MTKRRHRAQAVIPMTVRLPIELADRFYDEATAAGITHQEAHRQAIEAWLNMRQLDKEFSRTLGPTSTAEADTKE